MKNKMSDLRNHMFAALERLGDEKLSTEDLQKEIERSKAISELGKVLVESAKTEIIYAKLTGKGKESAEAFIDDKKQLDRPPATYSNKSPLGIASEG